MTIYATNAERPVAGNQYVPDSMEARGKIKPIPPVAGRRNGMGILVPTGPAAFEWRFKSMTLAEMDWWNDLIGHVSTDPNRVFSKRFVTTSLPAARLWDTTGVIVDYNVAVIDLPTWDEYHNARFHNVLVRFTSLFFS